MGIQADVLGAHALDIRNILAMTGDPPRTSDYADATAVFDVDAIGLIRILTGMNEGRDATGNSVGEPTAFCVGAALDPAAADPAGMGDFRQSRGGRSGPDAAVYDPEVLERFFRGARHRRRRVCRCSSVTRVPSQRCPASTVPDADARWRETGPQPARRDRDGPGAGPADPRPLCRRVSYAIVRPLRGCRGSA
jgi:hypothetical protein